MPEAPNDTFSDLLVTALDTAEVDPVRLDLLLRLMMLNGDDARAADLDRLRTEGLPPVFRL